MKFTDAAIPAGMVWSSPFARWQGSLAETSSLDIAHAVTSRALRGEQERGHRRDEVGGARARPPRGVRGDAVCAAPIAGRMIQALDAPAFGASHLTGTALAVAMAFTTLDPVGGLRHD